MPLSSARRGFTLIELCVAICIALLIVGIALPSLTGQLGRQRLQQAYDRFDALVTQAQQRSVGEGKPYVLVWVGEGAVRLYPAAWSAKERSAGSVAALLPAADTEHYTLVRDASLTRHPEASWMFWPTGNCEPVTIRFEGAAGIWTATYNALSARGTLTRFLVQ